ncbi:hypothetical protein PT974_05069 [Cladobotryum mycophilum]|uniref:Uncharacterized protein n=1 Tax=Cladobotryum mycophilum TaxID=491253 RepID=A0ABR0SS88_9HYPO
MASNSAVAPDASAANQLAQEEEALLQAMKRLKLLHIKERMLRDTIPKMIEPLVEKHSSPDAMFAAFMKAVAEAQAEVREFAELMRDDTSKEVFARADKSRQENPLGIRPWKHKDHPDWFNMDKD